MTTVGCISAHDIPVLIRYHCKLVKSKQLFQRVGYYKRAFYKLNVPKQEEVHLHSLSVLLPTLVELAEDCSAFKSLYQAA